MNISILKPRKALNKAFLKVKPNRVDIERFKGKLVELLDRMNERESEEFHKNLVIDFLKKTYYDPEHFVNTKGRNDLVIHNGKVAGSSVGVIMEAKKPTNRAEMVSAERMNTKAFQELVLYYLRERLQHKNLEVKHLVITNIYEWYIFDAQVFDRLFAQNKGLVRQFEDFEAGRLAETKTDFFYRHIAEPFIAGLETTVDCTYFDIRDYEKPLRNNDLKDDYKLIALYKLLSPEHLLKLPFVNDSNSLNEKFYAELLYILGLTEVKKGGKKLIERQKAGERNTGSLLENAIIQLDSLDKLSRLEKPGNYGDTADERLFSVALELSITWMNRILFLKLLEAQLLSYHSFDKLTASKGDKAYEFLSSEKIQNYDALNKLFFQVLAREQGERTEQVQAVFGRVPYLNSSLFEPTEMEHRTLFISNLEDDYTLPIYAATVVKDQQGKTMRGRMNTLEYLFAFLNAYDFSSEGKEAIQEENKTLINASVLGLIFEKINGYKDGSFFTPGFITMYMCRETIRRAVLQKFKENKGWECESIEALSERIEDLKEANSIINSLKICDPAVGSGHFLVSALNEIISVKNDLGVLLDFEGRRLKDYWVEVVNDELFITDKETGEEFNYVAPAPRTEKSKRYTFGGDQFNYTANKLPERQIVQQSIFKEKQTIIENCLFGVDINPNSVKICRLRLWIELLKNAYYKPDSNFTELETLPNIDINIKCGNSLISRFSLNASLKEVLKKNKDKFSIESYRIAVQTYRNATDKEAKRELENLILLIKQNFSTEIRLNDPIIKRRDKITNELYHRFTGSFLFEPEVPYGKHGKELQIKKEKKQKKLEKELEEIENKIEEIRSNKIYNNSFEWRFEFPEVLNNDGDFMGFDVVIGNPPYMRVQEIQASQPEQKVYYEQNYKNAKAAYDLANIFFELAINISAPASNNAYIFPHKFFNARSAEVFRDYLKEGQFVDKISHFGANMIFKDADTYTCIAQFSKNKSTGFWFQRFPFKSDFKVLLHDDSKYAFITYEMIEKASKLYGNNQWILFDDPLGFTIFNKIFANSKLFSEVFEGIFQGLATSKDNLYILDKIDASEFKLQVPISGKVYEVEPELFKAFLMGKDVQRYSELHTNKFVFFPYKIENDEARIVPVDEIQQEYPNTFKYIADHEHDFKSRESGKAGKMEHWHAYIYPKNLNKFEQPKLSSMEICSKHPNVIYNTDYFYHPTTVYSWYKKENTKESYEYLLAIANSKLLWWFLIITGDTLQGDARRMKTNYLNPFPLPETVEPKLELEIAEKVKNVISLKRDDPQADTSSLEEEIDRLVYGLYGLTEEEVKIVEG